MGRVLSKWIPRLLNLLAKLGGVEYVVVIATPSKERVDLFASTGGALWLSKEWTDAGNTFPAAIQASQLQRRTFAALMNCGTVDCSLPGLLEIGLQRAMMTTLLDALVASGERKFPFSSTTTEEFRTVGGP